MHTGNETIEVLNDLITINNDRIEGYEKAIGVLKDADADLKTLFAGMIDESRQAKMDLGKEVQVLGGEMEMGTTISGKIHRGWMEVKSLFTGHDRHSVLADCEKGEDALQDAYSTALEDKNMPAFLREMVEKQQFTFKGSHDEIKALRDSTVEA